MMIVQPARILCTHAAPDHGGAAVADDPGGAGVAVAACRALHVYVAAGPGLFSPVAIESRGFGLAVCGLFCKGILRGGRRRC